MGDPKFFGKMVLGKKYFYLREDKVLLIIFIIVQILFTYVVSKVSLGVISLLIAIKQPQSLIYFFLQSSQF